MEQHIRPGVVPEAFGLELEPRSDIAIVRFVDS